MTDHAPGAGDGRQPGQEHPELVAAALRTATELGFTASCEDPVGPLLATYAAAVPVAGRVLELGAGTGVGTAWLVTGLTGRQDVTLTTVEVDPLLADTVRTADLPDWVTVLTADAEAALPDLGEFDLIFADSVAGKWTGLELTVAALRPGGVLVVDDMDVERYADPTHRAIVATVDDALVDDPRLVSVRLPTGSGITVAVRRRG